MNDLQARLSRCFSAVFPGLNAQQIAAASVQTVEKWDSIAMVTLLSVIEEEFGVQFDPEDIETLASFQKIFDYVGARRKVVND